MTGTGQDFTLLVLTNVVLGIVCALFWLVVLAAICYELYRRWRIRASLPRGWPPEDEAKKPVIPDVWPPSEERSKHVNHRRRAA